MISVELHSMSPLQPQQNKLRERKKNKILAARHFSNELYENS